MVLDFLEALVVDRQIFTVVVLPRSFWFLSILGAYYIPLVYIGCVLFFVKCCLMYFLFAY